MMSVHNRDQLIRDHIRKRLLPYDDLPEPIDYLTMMHTQWSDKFIRYMRNRMTVGGYRYGLITDKSRQYDNIGSLIARAEEYLRVGNQEDLVDIANLAMIEFLRGSCHATPHWSPTDDGYHTQEL
jgi:hypothetical protein